MESFNLLTFAVAPIGNFQLRIFAFCSLKFTPGQKSSSIRCTKRFLRRTCTVQTAFSVFVLIHPQKLRKKKINAAGILFPCENCSMIPSPREYMQILPKNEKKKALSSLPIQIIVYSMYVGLFNFCYKQIMTAIFL